MRLRLRQNTLVTLGASAACAGLAVFLARGWIDEAVRSAAPAPTFADAPAPAALPTVPVLVAEVGLGFGDELAPDVLALVDYPEGSVPEGAFHSLSEVLDADGRVVALGPIVSGEPVLASKVSLPGSRAVLAQVVGAGMRATTIRVGDAEAVAGFVLPGDRVDVIYLRDEEGDGGTYALDMQADVLLQNVRVLAVDQLMDEGFEGAAPAATATLEVSLADAQRLAVAQDVGQLSLVLRSLGESDIAPTQTLVREDLLLAHAKPQAKPSAAPARPAVRAAARPASRPLSRRDSRVRISVVRGDEREEVRVVPETRVPETTSLAGG